MQYLLLLILIVLSIFAFYTGGKDILSPFFVSCISFLICLLYGLLFYSKWGITFSFITVLVIFAALIAVGIGEIMGKTVIKKTNNQFKQQYFYINSIKTIIMFFITLILLILFFNAKFQQAKIAGYSGGNLSEMLRIFRAVNYMDIDLSSNRLTVFSPHIIYGIGFFYSFVVINNIISGGNKKFIKKNLINFLPILVFAITVFLTMWRYFIFMYIVSCIFFIVIRLSFNNNGRVRFNKIRKYIFLAGTLMVATFFFVSSLSIDRFFDSSGIYLSSSIAALNNYLEAGVQRSEYFGKTSMFGLRWFISKLFGLNIKLNPSASEPAIFFDNGYYTNVYTALKAYICDFGYGGMILIQFIMGVFYGYLYRHIKQRKKIDAMLFIYVFIAPALVFQIINPEFLGSLLSLRQITIILMIVIQSKFLIKNKICVETKAL